MKSLIKILCIVFAAGMIPLNAADLPPTPKDTQPPAIRELESGEWLVGQLRLSKDKRTVSMPAQVNLTDGLIEYLLVHKTGKTHESIFSTSVPPYHLQVAMLLLGACGADPKVLTNAPSDGPINNASLLANRPPPVPGHPVEITVSWQHDGTRSNRPMESLLVNKNTSQPMTKGPWTFSGSLVWEGAFIAQIEGSIMSLITDVSAMFNCPHPDRDRDRFWFVRENILPPEETPVTIKITLLNKNEPTPGPARRLEKHGTKN